MRKGRKKRRRKLQLVPLRTLHQVFSSALLMYC
jgi:hypothetical protein